MHVQFDIGNNVDPFENVEHVEIPQMVNSVMEEVKKCKNVYMTLGWILLI